MTKFSAWKLRTAVCALLLGMLCLSGCSEQLSQPESSAADTSSAESSSQASAVSSSVSSSPADSPSSKTSSLPSVSSKAEEEPSLPESQIPEEEAIPEPIMVEGITLSTYTVTLAVGEQQMPIVSMSPDNAADKGEIWTSSDASVATVSSLGNITGVSEGTCTVTVTSTMNSAVAASVQVTVTPKAPDPVPQQSVREEQDQQARAIAQQIANSIGPGTDIERVGQAAMIVSQYYQNCTHVESGDNYYRPYGVFIAGEASCAGTTRALGLVLEYMGYSWVHVNENQWSHQWCQLTMDGQTGYADGQVGWVGYGQHPAA